MEPLTASQIVGKRDPLCIARYPGDMIERSKGITKGLKFKLLILCSKEIMHSLRDTLTGLKENTYHRVLHLCCVAYDSTS